MTRPLDRFVCETPQEEAAMELSRQLCDEGNQLCEQGKYQEAIAIFQQDLQLCEKVCGVEHAYVANSLIDISECYRGLGQFDLALATSRRALDIYENGLGADHLLAARGLREMAFCYAELGQSDRAIPLYQRVLEIRKNNYGAESAEVAWTINTLATLHTNFDQFAEALLLYRSVLAIREKLFGEEHADTLDAIRCISDMYEKLGQWDQALPLRQRAVAVLKKINRAGVLEGLEKLAVTCEKALGPEHAETISNITSLAMEYEASKQWNYAVPLRQRVLDMCKKMNGPEHSDTLNNIYSLEWVYQKLEKWEQVLELRQRAYEIERKTLDADHPNIHFSITHLASTHEKLGQWDQALSLRLHLLGLNENIYGVEHPKSLANLDKLANVYAQLGQWEQALPLRERLLILREKVHGQDSSQKRNSVRDLAQLYERIRRYEQALPLRQYLLEVQERGPYGRAAAADEVRDLADVYEKIGQYEQAQLLRSSLTRNPDQSPSAEKSSEASTVDDLLAEADAKIDLAQAYGEMGDWGVALEIYREALAIRQDILGSEHPDTINVVRMLAAGHEKLGQWDLALPLRQRVWAVCEKMGKEAIDKAADVATTAEYQNDSHRDALADRAIAKANELIIGLAREIEGGDYCAGYWKEYDIYPLAHHAVLGYLEHLWAGGERDDGFERRSLKNDFNMKGINIAALFYLVAQARSIPFDKVLHFLAPNAPDADESISAIFQKIMVIAPAMNEAGLSGEIKYLAGVVCGAFLDPNQIRYNSAKIHDDFDSVGFIVKYCKALELLKH